VKRNAISHEFVEYIPPELAEGVLYISMRYRTAVHQCACGCGNKVVTPIRPSEWTLVFDGDTVSLMPSIGSWQFPCRSHYWIRENEIRWSRQWTDEQIAAGRARDQRESQLYFAARGGERSPSDGINGVLPRQPRGARRPWRRVRDWLRSG
jgi:hypothetical protein